MLPFDAASFVAKMFFILALAYVVCFNRSQDALTKQGALPSYFITTSR